MILRQSPNCRARRAWLPKGMRHPETKRLDKKGGTMKRFLPLSFLLLLIGLAYGPASADPSSKAVASVFVNVHPTIAITPKTPVVNAGTIQTGDFSATIIYTIGANLEKVSMFLEASDLFKGDDPLGKDVNPIKLNTGRPAEITAQFGRRTQGLPNAATWNAAGNPIGAYPTSKTETVTYESSQKGHFSQDVACRIWYTQPDPQKAMGQYGGKVRLTTFITP